MKYLLFFIAAVLALFAPPRAWAIEILACEPEWAALAREVGGEHVRVSSATTALQNPHRIEARPSLIARARTADVLICTGAELEVGWVPLLLSQSGNPKIQKGRPGYFEAASSVRLIEVPVRADRAEGDVHPAGNPHLHLHPANIATVAAAFSERLGLIDPAHAADYAERAKSFLARWRQAMTRWEQDAAPLKGMRVVVSHRDLSYLVEWLGLREAGALEPKPGLPPTTSHMTELVARLARDPPKAIVRSAYNDPRSAEWLGQRMKIPVLVLPYTVGGTEKAPDLFALFDDTIARLLTAVP